jgi:hypothetical protein
MSVPASTKSAIAEVPFGGNEVRLTSRQWLVALAIIALTLVATPRLWVKFERFTTGSDYRIPYQLSNDYWLYARRLGQVADARHVIVLGDSVVWGEYVLPDGTLSHFLNQEAGKPDRFINAGVNGLFPLAQEGLIDDYGQALRHQKVILHYNVLWMTSPKADLSTTKEEPFNHSRLVPQFSPRIPCYKADSTERLSAIAERHIGFLAWVNHLQNAYFSQKSIPQWTLADDGGDPLQYPNAWKNPLAQITLTVPSAPQTDPQRGPHSPRHKPWTEPAQFDWVDLDSSLQWHAFQRVLTTLRQRDNDVLVLLGPFNEHMLSGENRAAYRTLRDGIARWLVQHRIPHMAPETLPSPLYADASHPLTQGYDLLAKRIYGAEDFQRWLTAP